MALLIGIIIILVVLCVESLLYLTCLKKQLRDIRLELVKNREKDYNRQITVQLMDKDLEQMTMELNRNLDYQKQLKQEQERQETVMKRSISDIAHDLRTPLTVVKGNLQMVGQADGLEEKNRNYIRICQERTEELRVMVDDFFELSVLESDKNPVKLSNINITNVLMQFLIDNEVLIKEKSLVPELEFPEKTLWIEADEAFLQRMLSNLLGNVVKYAIGTFGISLSEEGEYCRLTFSNLISQNVDIKVEHLFERSYMGDTSRNRKGNGLGLYIVKLLAEKQGAQALAKLENNTLFIYILFRNGRK